MKYSNLNNKSNIDHWLEPDFPINYLLDLSNYCILIFLLYFFCKFYKINNFIFYVSCLLIATPFFFNGFLIDWHDFSDQSKYINGARNLRSNFFESIVSTSFFDKIFVTSLFYNMSPTTNFETFRSIGFINRFIFILMILFFINKKYLSLNTLFICILSPSLMLYSSISLREILILTLMIFSIYNFLNKNYLIFFILIVSLLLIKFQNMLIVLFFCLLWNYIKIQNKKFANFILVIIFVGLTPYFDNILEEINLISLGFFSEVYSYETMFIEQHHQKYTLSNLFYLIPVKFIKFLISPFPDLMSIKFFLIFLENIIIYYLIYHEFFFQYSKKNKNQKMVVKVWLTVLIFSLSLYSIIIFNHGTIHRYKIIILIFILIAFNIQTKMKSINKNFN